MIGDLVAFANPDDVLAVFEHPAVWVDGNAMKVEARSSIGRGRFCVNHHTHSEWYDVPTVPAVIAVDLVCATKISRTERSGAVFTDYCGRGRHADGCPLASGLTFKLDDAGVPAANRFTMTDGELTFGHGAVRIESTDGVKWQIGVDYGSEPSTSVVAVTCARCSAVLSTSNEADPTSLVEAHKAKCFVMGDYVRWTPGMTPNDWADGEVTLVDHGVVRSVRLLEVSRGPWYAFPRRPCVGSTVDPSCCPSGLRRIPWALNASRIAHLAAPIPKGKPTGVSATYGRTTVTYDGLTAEKCLDAFVRLQRDDRWDAVNMHGETKSLRYPRLTTAQLAAARELWSLQLKAKVRDSAEAERCKVRVQIQDDEDPTW